MNHPEPGPVPTFLERHRGFYNPAEIQQLLGSTVAIAGTGGVGGRVAEVLARSGIGSLRLADPDVFSESNLNRQAGSSFSTLGQNKAKVLGAICAEVSPAINVQLFEEGIQPSNLDALISGADVIIDGTDYTVPSLGLMLARRAARERVPVVIGVEVGFGAWHSVLKRPGDFERLLGLPIATTLADLDSKRVTVPLWRWVASIPSYMDIDVLRQVEAGEIEAPVIGPAVELSTALIVTDVLQLLLDRPVVASAPKIHMVDVRSGRSSVFRPSSARFGASLLRARIERKPQLGAAAMGGQKSGILEDLPHHHVALLRESMRAPSAHNVQPWRIVVRSDGRYECHYHNADDLPFDPTAKDCYLTMGAFVENLCLLAPRHDLSVEVEEVLDWSEQDLHAATVKFVDGAGAPTDALASWVRQRETNRNAYDSTSLPASLRDRLDRLGVTLAPTNVVAPIVREQTIAAWQSPRFVEDLRRWFRDDSSATDGITPHSFHITDVDVLGLKLIFKLGRAPWKWLAATFAAKDVKVFTSGPEVGVVSVDERTPEASFDAGRRLLRAWVSITAEGFSYQPFSVAIDELEAAEQVAAATRARNPVALFRIGSTRHAARSSNRRPLEDVLEWQD